jgi:hypothetical protein
MRHAALYAIRYNDWHLAYLDDVNRYVAPPRIVRRRFNVGWTKDRLAKWLAKQGKGRQ